VRVSDKILAVTGTSDKILAPAGEVDMILSPFSYDPPSFDCLACITTPNALRIKLTDLVENTACCDTADCPVTGYSYKCSDVAAALENVWFYLRWDEYPLSDCQYAHIENRALGSKKFYMVCGCSYLGCTCSFTNIDIRAELTTSGLILYNFQLFGSPAECVGDYCSIIGYECDCIIHYLITTSPVGAIFPYDAESDCGIITAYPFSNPCDPYTTCISAGKLTCERVT
jgi:hypothetical protein